MNVTLKQLRVFTIVYEMRSFTLAAAATHMTQPAVSKLCAELEANLGIQLFERSTRQVVPLDAAAELYVYAQRMLGTLREAERSLDSYRKLDHGTVRFACSPMMAYGLLRSVLAGFALEHPAIRIELHEMSTDDSVEFVRSGRGDFALVSVIEPDPLMTLRPLRRERICLACAPDHPLARSRRVTWRRVVAEPHITIRDAYRFRRRVDQILAQQDLAIVSTIEVGTLPFALGLVRERLGVSVVPGYATEFARDLGLVILPIVTTPEQRHEISLLTRRDSRPTPAAAAFLDRIEGHLRMR